MWPRCHGCSRRPRSPSRGSMIWRPSCAIHTCGALPSPRPAGPSPCPLRQRDGWTRQSRALAPCPRSAPTAKRCGASSSEASAIPNGNLRHQPATSIAVASRDGARQRWSPSELEATLGDEARQTEPQTEPHLRADLRFGTFLPFLRASERPMAIACLRLLTVLPLLPLFSASFLRLRMAPRTSLEAPREYRRAIWLFLHLFHVNVKRGSATASSGPLPPAFRVRLRMQGSHFPWQKAALRVTRRLAMSVAMPLRGCDIGPCRRAGSLGHVASAMAPPC